MIATRRLAGTFRRWLHRRGGEGPLKSLDAAHRYSQSIYPTDSTLLGDGVRVLTRIMKKVTAVAGKVGTQMRDRSRSAKLKVLAIARASRRRPSKARSFARDCRTSQLS